MNVAGILSSFITSSAAGMPGQFVDFALAAGSKLPLVGKLMFYTVLFWGMFLAYVALHAAQRNGKLAATPVYVRVMSYAIVAVMLAFDVVFNLTVGSVLFLELPSTKALTFTARCNTHLDDQNFRGEIARWVCNGWLNPFEPGHCHT